MVPIIAASEGTGRHDGTVVSAALPICRARLRGLASGLRTLPQGRGWIESGVWSLLLVGVAAPLAWAGGLVTPAQAGPADARTLLEPFLVPALLEEGIFRGLLLPHPGDASVPLRRRARWWLASLVLYVGSHPLAATLFRPAARSVFDAPAFLLEAALLGIAATALYQRTGSLWPGVLLHGALVAAWLNLGGMALLSR